MCPHFVLFCRSFPVLGSAHLSPIKKKKKKSMVNLTFFFFTQMLYFRIVVYSQAVPGMVPGGPVVIPWFLPVGSAP